MVILTTEKYPITIRIMHWVMAIIIISMIGIGWYMSGLSKEDPYKSTLVGLHKSFGVLILILLCLRVFLRIKTKIPPLPQGIPLMQQKLAYFGHRLLYLFMCIVPLSGYAMSNMYGYGVKMFGVTIPNLFLANKEMAAIAKQAHSILPYILLAIIVLHIFAVLQHRFFDKPENDVLGRML